MSDPDTVLLQTEEAMAKAVDYLKHEFKGVRTGRASPSMVEFVKVEAYGSTTDLKSLAAISVPEPTQILIKPFDPSIVGDIKRGIEAAGLGMTPIVDAKQIRLNVPALSGERRQQMVTFCKKKAEETKVTLRNVRRDANKNADALGKLTGGKQFPEDDIKQLHEEIQELLKKFEGEVDKKTEEKCKEITTV